MKGSDEYYSSKRVVNLIESSVEDFEDEESVHYMENYRGIKTKKLRTHDIDNEIQTLRDAHSVLLKRQNAKKPSGGQASRSGSRQAEVVSEVKDVKPEDNYNDFLNFQDVRCMIEEMLVPVIRQIPRLRKEVDANGNTILGLVNTCRNLEREVKGCQASVHALNAYTHRMNRIDLRIDKEKELREDKENK